MNGPKILLIDIETAPINAYTWGLYDQNISPAQIIDNAYMLCWSAKWLDKKELMFDSIFKYKSHFEKNPKSDLKIAESAWKLMDEADIVIAHNGDNFDIKWLNTVFWKNNLKPVSNFKTIDTCKVARSHFKLGSNKLDEIAKLLGIGKKLENEGFPLWIKCMFGDTKAWKKMEEYNKHDVKLLEAVYLKMRPFIKNHPNLALYISDDKPVCNGCGGVEFWFNGNAYTKNDIFKRYRCKNCGKESRGTKSLLTKDKRDSFRYNVI